MTITGPCKKKSRLVHDSTSHCLPNNPEYDKESPCSEANLSLQQTPQNEPASNDGCGIFSSLGTDPLLGTLTHDQHEDLPEDVLNVRLRRLTNTIEVECSPLLCKDDISDFLHCLEKRFKSTLNVVYKSGSSKLVHKKNAVSREQCPRLGQAPLSMKHDHQRSLPALRRCKDSVPQQPPKGSRAVVNSNSQNDDLQEEDDDGEPAVGELLVRVQVGDKEKIHDFYIRAFMHIGQVRLKQILKAMIKVVQPRKQTKNPYNGRRSRAQAQNEFHLHRDDPNPGKETAPDWWPNQEGWQDGKGSRHKEPDHTLKPERLYLVPHLIRLTGQSPAGTEVTVAKFREATRDIRLNEEQSKLLQEVFDVRVEEQRFEENEIDADAITFIRESLKPSRKSSKSSCRKSHSDRRLFKSQTSAAPIYPTSEVPAVEPASLSSGEADADIKTEQLPLDTLSTELGYNLVNDQATVDRTFLGMPGKSFVCGQMVDAATDQVFFKPEVLQNCSMQDTTANGYPLRWPPDLLDSSDAMTSELFHASVTPGRALGFHEPSSSFNEWDYQDKAQDLLCDQVVRYGQRRQSDGTPTEPLVYDLTDPATHSHALGESRQQITSARNGCSYGQAIPPNVPMWPQQQDGASITINPDQIDLSRAVRDVHDPGSSWHHSIESRLTRSFPT